MLSLSTQANKLAGVEKQSESWRLIYLLNYYRLGLSLLLVVLYLTGSLFKPLGSHSPLLFIVTACCYLISGVVIHQLLNRQVTRLKIQIYLNIIIDVIFITLLMHSSGGVSSGIGSLMVVSIACGSILLSGRAAFFPASLASLVILTEQGFIQISGSHLQASFLQSGILGITFFATSILAIVLAWRLQESEALAKKQSIDLANMAQLTEHVVQRMQTGVIVVDEDMTVRLINASAWQMLGLPPTSKTVRLNQLSDLLRDRLIDWRHDPFGQTACIQPVSTHTNIQPRFARIGQYDGQGSLIFLEDISATAQQAQQMQLASLGQLTASIAHEIRNPLGAISHAGQLLSESESLAAPDQRLTQIISDNTRRLNAIVENVMQVSRRDPHHIELITLKNFLDNFLLEYQLGQAVTPGIISIHIEPEELEIRFDTSHLRQILVNLCDNALRHSADYGGLPKVELIGGTTSDFNRPFLDVVDHGPGVRADDIPHLFEPFFTSSTNGTGLGLYISRQLAESNQAHLNYVVIPTGGACFRISFQDPRRNIN
ncbi:MAG: HAMP domain-containing histidine kinase [Gammaproteobacteria bacterium]|nr:HAMP domain-containing histidine kinase [Gammaproteobacteria bacterium]